MWVPIHEFIHPPHAHPLPHACTYALGKHTHTTCTMNTYPNHMHEHTPHTYTLHTVYTNTYITRAVPHHTPHMHAHSTWTHTGHTRTPHTYRRFTYTLPTPNVHGQTHIPLHTHVTPGPVQIYSKLPDTFCVWVCVYVCLCLFCVCLSLSVLFSFNPGAHIYCTTQSTHTDTEQTSGLM